MAVHYGGRKREQKPPGKANANRAYRKYLREQTIKGLSAEPGTGLWSLRLNTTGSAMAKHLYDGYNFKGGTAA